MNEPQLRSLAERAAFLDERRLSPDRLDRLDDDGLAMAEARLDLWRKDALLNQTTFAERLRAAGLSESELLSMFADGQAMPSEKRGDGREPGWLDVFRDVTSASCFLLPALPAECGEDGQLSARFARFVAPFVEVGRRRLRAAIATERQSSFGPGVERSLVWNLWQALAFEATRTLVLELNVARTLDRLRGDTSEERFAHFATVYLADPQRWAAIIDEYPVLARLMATTVERWFDTALELLRRLSEDRPIIERHFSSGRKLGALAEVRSGLSDSHRGGRTVAILSFDSGQRIVYKPKSLAVDVEFQCLIDWLNTTGVAFEHRTLKVLNRGAYGWVEFAEWTPCDTVEEVRGFYFRQGSLLALLHLLRATDVHFENVIASGAHPVVVDLETLFHHRRPSGGNPTSSDRALLAIQESVFWVGLLPVFALERGPASGVDFSALGGRPGQSIAHPMPVLEDTDRDTMRIALRSAITAGADNRPSLRGQEFDAAAYAESVVDGFVDTYSRLVEGRSALETRLEGFAQVEVRHVMRPTFQYKFLLNSALHPDFLRDGLARERALNRLWSAVPSQPGLCDLVSYERLDLLAGDVPIFTTRPGSRDLWNSRGERVPNFFPQASLDLCRQRLAQMGDLDCAGQVKLLQLSLQALH